jgi:hypothetical protein
MHKATIDIKLADIFGIFPEKSVEVPTVMMNQSKRIMDCSAVCFRLSCILIETPSIKLREGVTTKILWDIILSSMDIYTIRSINIGDKMASIKEDIVTCTNFQVKIMDDPNYDPISLNAIMEWSPIQINVTRDQIHSIVFIINKILAKFEAKQSKENLQPQDNDNKNKKVSFVTTIFSNRID